MSARKPGEGGAPAAGAAKRAGAASVGAAGGVRAREHGSRFDARIAFACLVVYFVAAFHAKALPAICLCLAAAALAAVVARLGVRGFFGVLRPLTAVLAVTVVMQVLYLQHGEVLAQLGPVAVTAEALAASGRMLACLLSIMVMSAAFMRAVTPEALLHALSWALAPLERAGLHTGGVVLSLTVAFRFVPVLLDEFRQLKHAQEARLASFDGSVRQRLGAYTKLFAPLTRSAFRRADMLAEACCARCFACGVRATTINETKPTAADAALTLATAMFATVVSVL